MPNHALPWHRLSASALSSGEMWGRNIVEEQWLCRGLIFTGLVRWEIWMNVWFSDLKNSSVTKRNFLKCSIATLVFVCLHPMCYLFCKNQLCLIPWTCYTYFNTSYVPYGNTAIPWHRLSAEHLAQEKCGTEILCRTSDCAGGWYLLCKWGCKYGFLSHSETVTLNYSPVPFSFLRLSMAPSLSH